MFLHIGNSRIVFKESLIGIFHMKLKEDPINKQFIESANKGNFGRNVDFKNYKSFIITDHALLFSPVVPETLARRNRAPLNG